MRDDISDKVGKSEDNNSYVGDLLNILQHFDNEI